MSGIGPSPSHTFIKRGPMNMEKRVRSGQRNLHICLKTALGNPVLASVGSGNAKSPVPASCLTRACPMRYAIEAVRGCIQEQALPPLPVNSFKATCLRGQNKAMHPHNKAIDRRADTKYIYLRRCTPLKRAVDLEWRCENGRNSISRPSPNLEILSLERP